MKLASQLVELHRGDPPRSSPLMTLPHSLSGSAGRRLQKLSRQPMHAGERSRPTCGCYVAPSPALSITKNADKVGPRASRAATRPLVKFRVSRALVCMSEAHDSHDVKS